MQTAPRVLDPLPETASLLLDVVRFALCLLVLVGHATEPMFSSGWPQLMLLAMGRCRGSLCCRGL